MKDTLENNTELMALLGEDSIFVQNSTNRNYPYITFFVLDERGHLFADDIELSTEYIVQVDIWSKEDYTTIVGLVKESMTAAGFRRTSAADLYESDVGIYHKGIRFSYYL